MWFTSDNAAGIDPVVLEAVAAANDGGAAGYGQDTISHRAQELVRAVFETERAWLFPVSTGTAANAIALAALTPSWGAVLCHELAHIERDEAGAPEFFTRGGKLVLLEGAHALIDAKALEAALAAPRHGVHSVHPHVLSLSQASERGTVYAPDAIAGLCRTARSAGLRLHMDGARFANAVVSTGAAPADLTWRAGIDILSLGLTKNGAMSAEAIICFDEALAGTIATLRKRGGQLASKMRFRAAEIVACLEHDRWLDNARHANGAAARLRDGLLASGQAELVHPVDANMVFARMPRDVHFRLKAGGAMYHLTSEGTEQVEARLVTSFATTDAEIDRFLTLIA
jgi:threonine aldolase